MTGNAGDGAGQRMSPWRMAAWVAAALVLLLPVAAMQLTDEVNWTRSDFVVAAVLLFGSLGAYEFAARMTSDTLYRAGVGLAIAATFLLIWGNGALSITDSSADAMYYGVAGIGIVGVVLALLRPIGGAYAMFVAALFMVLATVVTLADGMVPNDYVSVFELAGLTGFYASLFVGAAWLLREAVREG